MKPHAWTLGLVVLLLGTAGAGLVSRGLAEETHYVEPKDTGEVEKNFDIDKDDEEIVNPEPVSSVGGGKIKITTKTFKHPTGWKFKAFTSDLTPTEPHDRRPFNPGQYVDIEIDPACLPPKVEKVDAPTVTVPQDGVDAIKVVVTDLTVPPTVGWPLKCEGNLEPPPRRGGGGKTDKTEWHWSAKMSGDRAQIAAYFKIVENETQLTEQEEGTERFFRTLAGFRLRLEARVGDPVDTYQWATTQGKFYESWKHDAAELTGEQLQGAALKEIWWEGAPDIGEGGDATITLTVRLKDATQLTATANLKTRLLLVGTNGDDTKMLQAFLRITGVSTGKFGWRGTPIVVDGKFSTGTDTGVKRLQKRVEITQDGKVENGTLADIEKQWNDYLAAYDAFPTSPVVDLSHANFDNWLNAGEQELGKTYTDALVAEVDPTVTRKTLLQKWVEKEANVGHWGKQDRFRVVLLTFAISKETAAGSRSYAV